MPNAFRSLARRTYLAIAMLGLVGTLILGLLPSLLSKSSSSSGQPPVLIYLVAGLVGLAVTAAALVFVGKFEPGLKRRLLWLVFAYNALIVAVKLVLAPLGLYELNRSTVFTVNFASPNSLLYYILSGGVVFFLYALVWFIIFRVYRHRATVQLAGANPIGSPVGNTTPSPAKPGLHPHWRAIIPLTVAIAIAIYLSGVWGWVLFVGLSGFDYISLLVSSAIALPIAVCLLAAIALASGVFREAEQITFEVKDATMLASLFWLGLALIALYHVMWIVFMVTLVTTWPFNTYTPK